MENTLIGVGVFFSIIGAAGWLNARLFHMPTNVAMLLAGLLAAVTVVLAESAAVTALVALALTVGAPGLLMNNAGMDVDLNLVPLLTWGDVRGAGAIALALAVTCLHREEVLAATYGAVLLSMLLQTPTLPAVAERAGNEMGRA